jgi:hypothetical protein
MTRYLLSILTLCTTLCCRTAAASPTGSAFTYQGVLKQGGAPANGTYNLRFQLWDALSGGAQVGADVDLPAVTISNGQFTVELDFGAVAFSGQARWLAVQVVTNGGSTVTTLTPRQPVNASPYAVYALKVDGPNLTNLNASNLTSGTVPSAQFSGTYSNALSLTNASNAIAGTFTGAFSGSGASINNLNATNIASGTLSTARLPTGGSWPLTSALNIDSNTLVIDVANNRVGVGTTTPTHTVHIASNAPTLALQDTDSTTDQVGYVSYRDSGNVERGWVGYGSPSTPHFSVLNARAGGDVLLQCLGASGSVRLYPGVGGEVQIGAGFADVQHVRIGTGTTDGFLFTAPDFLALGFNHYIDSGGTIHKINSSRIMSEIRMNDAGISFLIERALGNLDGLLNCNGSELTVNARAFIQGPVLIGGSSSGFDLNVTGTAGKSGGGSWSSLSDRRLKKNIQPLHNALDSLLALRGVTYEYIDPKAIGERAGTRIGMIAQEVEQVFPDWVEQTRNGYKSVTFRGFEALTVEALRELRDQHETDLASLRAEKNAQIEELRGENQRLQDRLAALEAAVARAGDRKEKP